MKTITDFIKNFDPSVYGLEYWHLWIGFMLLALLQLVLNRLASFLSPATEQRVKKYLSIVFNTVFIGIVVSIVLNAFLTERYSRLAALIFCAAIPFLPNLVDKFFAKYDKAVDRRMDNTRD